MHHFHQNLEMSQKAIQQESSQKPTFLSQGLVKPQSQADASQTSQVASQGQVLTRGTTALQENVLSQDGVSSQVKGASSQPVVSTLSQFSSQKSVSAQSQGCVPSQNQSQLNEKENIDQSEIDLIINHEREELKKLEKEKRNIEKKIQKTQDLIDHYEYQNKLINSALADIGSHGSQSESQTQK